MDIDFPKNWVYNYNKRFHDYCIGKNTETDVHIGYKLKANADTFSLWVGEHLRDHTVIKRGMLSKNEVKRAALKFMEENPEVEYKDGDIV